MSKLVRLNSKTLTIKRTWQGAPVSFGRYKKLLSVYAVDVNKRQLCDLEPILCSFLRLGKGSMGISPSRLTHRLDNLRLGDPDLCPYRVCFQEDSSQRESV